MLKYSCLVSLLPAAGPIAGTAFGATTGIAGLPPLEPTTDGGCCAGLPWPDPVDPSIRAVHPSAPSAVPARATQRAGIDSSVRVNITSTCRFAPATAGNKPSYPSVTTAEPWS